MKYNLSAKGMKENVRNAVEQNTGLIGQAMRARRQTEEKQARVQKELDAISETTSRIKSSHSALTSIETSFIQISKNFEVINKSFGVVVTTQDETNKALAATPITKTPSATGVTPPTHEKETKQKDTEDQSIWNDISSMFDLLERGVNKVKKVKRVSRAGKKARAAAKKRGLSSKQIKEAGKLAEQKAAQRAEKEAAKKVGAKAATNVSKAAIKEAAKKTLAKSLGKMAAKSIPFVGAAVGIGFAVGKLLQGDAVGAGIEAVSGLGSAITSIPATIAAAIRDIYFEMYGVWPEGDPKNGERFEEIKKAVTETAEEILGKKVEPQPQAKPTAAATAAPPVVPPPSPPPAPVVPPPSPPPAAARPVAAAAPSAPIAAAPTPISAPTVTAAPPGPPKTASGGEAIMEQALKDQNFDLKAIAAIMAQTSHESGHFKILEENLNYSASGLKGIFGKYFKDVDPKEYERQPQKIASRVYADRMGNGNEASGDGWKYRGRGFIQLTGKQNYADAGKALGIDLVNNPDLAADPKTAALIAIWFFKKNIKRITDWANVEQITKIVNGGVIGLADRKKEFDNYLAKFSSGGGTMVAAAPSTGAQVAQSSTEVSAAKPKVQQNNVTILAINETNTTRKKVPAPGAPQTAGAIG